MRVSINHKYEKSRIDTVFDDLIYFERRNSPYFAFFHRTR